MPHPYQDNLLTSRVHASTGWLRNAFGEHDLPHLSHFHLSERGNGYVLAAWIVTGLGILNWILFTAVTLALTRHLTHADFGWYGSAIAACGLVVTVSTLGLEKLAIKLVPEFRSREALRHWKGFLIFGLLWSLFFSVVIGIVAFGMWLLFDHPDHNSILLFRRLMYFVPVMALFMFFYEVCSTNNINIRTTIVYRVMVPACVLGLVWFMIERKGDNFLAMDAAIAYGASWVIGLIAVAIWPVRSTPTAVIYAKAPIFRAKHWLLGGMGFSLSMMLIGAAPILVLTAVRTEADAGTMAVLVQITSVLILS